MEMKLDRRAEYAQMFDEIWRLDRDYFYDKNMHGVDWPKMKERYRALLPYVANRFDLTYIAGEMMSELACSHTYVGGGEKADIPPSKVGLLGCDFAVDKQNNRIKIARILKGENWDEALRSPLRDPEIDVKEGDYLLAINGKEVIGDIDPYSLMVNTLGQTVTLTVNGKPSMTGAHDVTVKPIAEDEALRYYTWVENNRHYVDSISGGKIGYIHIPDMGGGGLVRFLKMFYNQIQKEGLIIDVRYNGGGFVSRLVLGRLSRKVTGVSVSRNFAPDFSPGDAVNAHMITLANQFSTSDGDNFPYFFRLLGLGPVMGMRTWGGVVGIRGFRPLSDGGFATVSEFTTYSLDSKWVMENHGVDPDIVVDNTPERAAKGFDDQLDKAIEYIAKKIKEQPIVLPPYPGPPAKR
jgi:tricorn protease